METAKESGSVKGWPFCTQAVTLENNILREILKVTSIPGIISFAGGMPAEELFPYEGILRAATSLLGAKDGASLQYSLSRGTPELRQWIIENTPSNTPLTLESVLVTSGAQQGLDIVGRSFLEPGDRVLTTTPTYVGLIHAFNYYRADLVTCETGDEGIDPDDLEAKLSMAPAKLIYLVPSYDNPTGRTMPMDRREAVMKLAAKFGVPVIDDNPYGDLYYDGNPMTSLRLLNPEWTIELRTFSKTISPGLRIGWMHAPEPHLAIFEKMKQATDLHTNTFCQRLIHAYCSAGLLPDHVEGLRTAYRSRLAVMLDSLEREMPQGVSWVEPKGGLFIWLTLPPHMDSEHLLKLAVEAKVAFVPGRPFYPKDGAANTLRLNFSNQPEDRIKDGIARLAKIFKREL